MAEETAKRQMAAETRQEEDSFISRMRRQIAESRADSAAKGKLFLLPLIAAVLEGCGGGGGGNSASPQNGGNEPPQAREIEVDGSEIPYVSEKNSREDLEVTITNPNPDPDGVTSIVTGSGSDLIRGWEDSSSERRVEAREDGDGESGSTVDYIRAGTGGDRIYAGDGDDVIVVVGVNVPGSDSYERYESDSITNPRGSGIDVSSIVSLEDLNNNPEDEAAGDKIDGGEGEDTLIVYGMSDLQGMDIRNIETILINSDVTIGGGQITSGGIKVIKSGDGSLLRIIREGDGEVTVGLGNLGVLLEGVTQLHVGEGVTLSVSDSGDDDDATSELGNIELISGEGTVQVEADDPDAFDGVLVEPGLTVAINGGTDSSDTVTVTAEHEEDGVFGSTITSGKPLAGGGLRFESSDKGWDADYNDPDEEEFAGTNNRDAFLLGPGDTATGRAGSDYFIIEGRWLDERSSGFKLTYTVTDFEEGVDFIILDGTTFIEGSGGTRRDPTGRNKIKITFEDHDSLPNTGVLTVWQQQWSARKYEILLEGITTADASAESFDYRYISQNSVTKGGNQLGGVVAQLWINNDPEIVVPSKAVRASQDTSLEFLAINNLGLWVSDPNDDELEVTVTVEGTTGGGSPRGTLTVAAGSGEVTGDGTHALTIRGSEDEINARLEGLVYTPAAGIYGDETLTITARDVRLGEGDGEEVKGDPVSAEVSIAVNAKPEIAPGQIFTVAEDATVIGTVVASDPDTGDTLIYEITGGNDNGLFVIDENTGAITIADGRELDYETATSHTLTVTVQDRARGGLSDSETVTVTVTDVNEAPTIAAQVFTVIEGTTAIGTVAASDPDGDSLIYDITGGNGADLFVIDENSGAITVADGKVLDYESASSHALTVTVEDRVSGGESDSTTVTVSVVDDNEAPTSLVLDNGVIPTDIDTSGAVDIGTLSAFDPEGQTVSYQLERATLDTDNSDAAGIFQISGDKLQVRQEAVLSGGIGDSYTVTVRMTTADGGPASLQEVTVTVGGANLAAGASIDENDRDAHDFAVTFRGLEHGRIESAALAEGTVGTVTPIAVGLVPGQVLRVTGPYDYETTLNGRLAITITVSHGDQGLEDAARETFTQTLFLTINDVNEAPIIVAQTLEVDEGATAVGKVIATDPDTIAGDSLIYEITAGNGDRLFVIDENTGTITVADGKALDHEDAASHTLTVTVKDRATGGLSDSATVTVEVQDINEAPVMGAATYSFDSDENVSSGSTVGTVSATDEDTGDSVTYAITAGNTDDVFTIDASSGVITTSGALDHEDTGEYTLTVTATDRIGVSAEATVTVTVNDINEAPVMDTATYGFDIDEDATSGTLGTVSARDEDEGDSVTYSIKSGNVGGVFAIDRSSGVITLSGALDHESIGEYTLTVRATDGDGARVEATVIVTVNDVNEAPVMGATAYNFDINENVASGSAVGTVSARDEDDGDSVTYAITAGNIGSAFTIDGSSGVITTTGALDHEDIGEYTLTVTATDGDRESAETTVTVTVNDINEAPVMGATAYGFNINENVASGSAVGTVSAGDEDEGDSVTYAITEGNTGSVFTIDGSSGVITTSGALDHEDIGEYTLTVTATDGDGASAEATVTVTVGDTNDAPVMGAATYNFDIDEDATSGTVGTVSASDEDAGDTVTYAITAGNTGSAFTIDGSSGVITLSGALDHEGIEDEYTLTVTATDSDRGSATATVTVTVNDVNEAPVMGAATYSFSITENVASGSTVGTVIATDEDDGDSVTYTITGGNTGSVFTIGASSGIITTSGALDRETTGEYTLTVTATDGDGASAETTVTVTVNDVNEAPTGLTLDGRFISTSINTGTSAVDIGTLSATDPEDQTVSYVLVSATLDADSSDASGIFQISDGKLQIQQGATVTADAGDTYTVTVQATTADGGLASESVAFTVTVGGVALAESASLDENTAGYVDIVVTFEGLRNGKIESASVPEGTVTPIGHISGQALRITGPYDYEALSGELEITLTVSHGDTNLVEGVETADREEFTQTLLLPINDVNEAPESLALDRDWISVTGTTSAPFAVGTLSAADDPEGDSVSYSVQSVTLAGATVSGVFEISGENILQVASGANVAAEGSVYTVTVRATDTGSPAAYTDETFSITVLNRHIGTAGADDEELTGGSGRDYLDGGDRDDTLTGGAGADIFAYHIDSSGTQLAGSGTDDILDFSVGEDKLLFLDLDIGDEMDYDEFYAAFGTSTGYRVISVTPASVYGLTSHVTLGDGEADTVRIQFADTDQPDGGYSGNHFLTIVLTDKIDSTLYDSDSGFFKNVDSFIEALGGEDAFLFG